MIIVKIQGGLGNQLFQYALGRHIRERHHVEVKYDISWYAGQSYRKYELPAFNVTAPIASSTEIRAFKRYKKKPKKYWFLYNAFIADETKYIREKDYIFNPAILEVKNDAYLDGIWQTESYFKDIADIIRAEFTLRSSLSLQHDAFVRKINYAPSVSICIRRGDFVYDKKVSTIHGALSMEYYYDAIKKIAEMVENPHIFVFSDDISWVKENFKTIHPMTCVSDGHTLVTSEQELILMSLCKHVISANSTFSWWAAWLNQNPDKIVISPKTWYKTGYRNHPDLILPSWITIENTFI